VKACGILLFICLTALSLATCGGSTGPANTEAGGLYPVVKDGKWGYIDSGGKVVIELQFSRALDFHDGLARVARFEAGDVYGANARWGYIDKTGKVVIEPQFSEAVSATPSRLADFAEGLAFVVLNGKTVCIDKSGKVVFEVPADLIVQSPFSDGLAHISQRVGTKSGYMDKTGKVAIELQYDYALEFAEGLAGVKVGDKFGYIDRTGKMVIEPQFSEIRSFSDGMALASTDAIEYGKKFGYIDKTGKMVTEAQFEFDSQPFKEGLAFVRISPAGKYGYIDKAGKFVIELTGVYYRAEPFSEGTAWVAQPQWQIVDKTGKVVATPKFNETAYNYQEPFKSLKVNEFKGGLARVENIEAIKSGGVAGISYVNQKGELIWPSAN
jgi:hypothetical protein